MDAEPFQLEHDSPAMRAERAAQNRLVQREAIAARRARARDAGCIRMETTVDAATVKVIDQLKARAGLRNRSVALELAFGSILDELRKIYGYDTREAALSATLAAHVADASTKRRGRTG